MGDGWVVIPGVLDPSAAAEVAARCEAVLARSTDDRRPGDKAVAGTHHLVDLLERVPEVAGVVDHPAVVEAVTSLLGPAATHGDVAFRSPQPGYGGQRLHADAVPRLDRSAPFDVVTAIVALCDFTEENGATGVVPGSHQRPDQQRAGGRLEQHPDEVVLTGPAGTAFVFCGHLLHRGRTNRSAAARPALQAVWRRAGTAFPAMGADPAGE